MKSILTVTTAAATADLTVLATVKAELGIAAQENKHDLALTPLIRAASDIVATHCRRVFGSETVSETFWQNGSCSYPDCLILGRMVVSDIDSVTLDDVLVDDAEYRIDAGAGMLYRLDSSGYPSHWSFSKSAVIVYTAGYVLLDGLPYGIERAAVLLIKEFWSGKGRDPRIKSEDVPGIQSVEYWVGQIGQAGELPPDVLALLAPHVRPIMA